MLHLLQKWCPCGTTDRPEGTLSGAASDEPSVSTLGTHELSYSAPGNSTLGAPAALVSRYTPSDYSGAEPSGACSPSTGSSTPLTASTVQAQAQDTVSEVSDASMLVHLFHDTGYSAVGAVDSPQADDDGAESAVRCRAWVQPSHCWSPGRTRTERGPYRAWPSRGGQVGLGPRSPPWVSPPVARREPPTCR
eukprot:TRINITY_DN4388_c0_g2_i1.p1 TRINITY_DN4388_c0_g2~~TRINITY_DN4388_c0_g2_i1.p1  ORF type:complete len:220 (+),score=17.27 TRINITY_DN4388_c0_g2_i1:86-661(+)